MSLESFGLSEVGPVRKTNEDCFVRADELQLFVVADGMGGHATGEVASRVAVESIENFIRRSHNSTDFSWPYGIDPTLSYEGNRLKTAINLANRRIHRLAENHDDYLGMGTTVVSVLLSGRRMIVGHVGDSRLYSLNENGLSQLTADDSWAATVFGNGNGHGRGDESIRHVLTNVLGARADTEVHLAERSLTGSDMLLLCSDGLHGSVSHAAIQSALTCDRPLREIVEMLVHSAIAAGSRDNITALAIRCTES